MFWQDFEQRRRFPVWCGLVVQRALVALTLAATALAVLAGCDRAPGRADAIATLASTNVPAAAVQLNQDWASGRLVMSDSIDLAHTLLDAGDPRGAGFGAAVLQTIEDRRDQINDGAEFEIFWRQVGRLACKTALADFQADRFDDAARWVFGGTARWQSEAYWMRYPDHDALASYCLTRTGRRTEAIQRLEDRPALDGDAAEALRVLMGRGVSGGE
jgi:hypothetical protein